MLETLLEESSQKLTLFRRREVLNTLVIASVQLSVPFVTLPFDASISLRVLLENWK